MEMMPLSLSWYLVDSKENEEDERSEDVASWSDMDVPLCSPTVEISSSSSLSIFLIR